MDGNYQHAEHTYIFDSIPKGETVAEWRYELPYNVLQRLTKMPSPFTSAYSEATFLDSYSRSTTRPKKIRPRNEAIRHHTVPPTWMNESMINTPSRDRPTRRECWTDTVIRVIEGAMSHYVSHLKSVNVPVDVAELDSFAEGFAYSVHRMECIPPGRGLFAMGTDYTYLNGNSALNNCYAASTKDNLIEAAVWIMDMLMVGGGTGFDVDWRGQVIAPDKTDTVTFVIPDTRQGWVAALELLLRSYIPLPDPSNPDAPPKITNKFPVFDYSLIRPYGSRIHGFGGTASGSQPLIDLLNRTETWLDSFLEYQELVKDKKDGIPGYDVAFWQNVARALRGKGLMKNADRSLLTDEQFEVYLDELKTIHSNHKVAYDHTRLIADIINSIGTCVLAGNVRRSAQIALGDPEDHTFVNLKNWDIQKLRKPIMGLSNNSVRFWNNEQFEKYLSDIVKPALINGEPGIANFINIQKYARMGDTSYGPDAATLLNPCAEISLESFEPCCLSTVIPIRCCIDGKLDMDRVRRACQYATFYATVVTTIPHHWKKTNAVIDKNRRIGVSFGGIADLLEELGTIGDLITVSRDMYSTIRKHNDELAYKLKINRAIRVTTVKPEGTIGIITDTSPGVHFPIISHGERRICFDNCSDVLKTLTEANYPTEKSVYADNQTYVVFPVRSHSKRSARNVTIYEKFLLAQVIQRHYADNSVSFTGDFDPKTELALMQDLIAMTISQTKVISILPMIDTSNTEYDHVPFVQTDEETYQKICDQIKAIDWSSVYNSIDVEDISSEAVNGCTGDSCKISLMKKSKVLEKSKVPKVLEAGPSGSS